MFNLQKSQSLVRQHHIDYQAVDMIKDTPSAETIEEWLNHNEVPMRRLFNTSGMKYRELGLKDQIADFIGFKS